SVRGNLSAVRGSAFGVSRARTRTTHVAPRTTNVSRCQGVEHRPAVLPVCNIAQINWQRLALLNHSGGIAADRREMSSRPHRRTALSVSLANRRYCFDSDLWASGALLSLILQCRIPVQHHRDGRRWQVSRHSVDKEALAVAAGDIVGVIQIENPGHASLKQ